MPKTGNSEAGFKYAIDLVSVEVAKGLFRQIQADPLINERIPVKTVEYVFKAQGIRKREVKEARRQLKIPSIRIDGEQYWLIPKSEEGNNQ